MENLQLVATENFNGVMCDFYRKGNQLWMTRAQIGLALEYSNPMIAIGKLHNQHKDRLDKFSVLSISDNTDSETGKVFSADGKCYNTYLYSQRGVLEICRWSRQPKADAFMDWVWDVIEAYRNGTLQRTLSQPQNDFSKLCIQVNEMEKVLDNLYDRLKSLEENQICSQKEQPTLNTSIMQKPIIDPIRDTIEPLAKLYKDGSKGYNCTYRKVYDAMGCDWKYRRTRYKNYKGNKNIPSKIKLIESDKKLLKLFVDTVNQLMENSLQEHFGG